MVSSAAGTGSQPVPHNTCNAAKPFPNSARVDGWAPTPLPQLCEAEPLNHKILELPFFLGDGWETLVVLFPAGGTDSGRKIKLKSLHSNMEKTVSPLGKVYSAGKLGLFPSWV